MTLPWHCCANATKDSLREASLICIYVDILSLAFEAERLWALPAWMDSEGSMTPASRLVWVQICERKRNTGGVVAQLRLLAIHIVTSFGYTSWMTKPPPTHFRASNWTDYIAALRKRGPLEEVALAQAIRAQTCRHGCRPLPAGPARAGPGALDLAYAGRTRGST